jgi:toxin FitB
MESTKAGEVHLDTNVVSELMRATASENVVRWVGELPATTLHITAVTQAEILHGILLLPRGKRRAQIEAAAEAMFQEEFDGRILPFGSDAARAFAETATTRRTLGQPISQFDAQIAAIAGVHRATLATRNVSDFASCGIRVVNPWRAE